MGYAACRFLALHFCNPFLALASTLSFVPIFRLSRKHLVRHVSYPRLFTPIDLGLDHIRHSPRNGKLGQKSGRARPATVSAEVSTDMGRYQYHHICFVDDPVSLPQ